MDVPVYNMQGAQVGVMPIDEKALGGTINPALITGVRDVPRTFGRVEPTKSALEVEGSTKKIYMAAGHWPASR